MKLKHLESYLSSVTREFPDPKVTLEQYPTSAELTAYVIKFASDRNDLGPGRIALDLGCGTGMLAIGCALVECDMTFGVDCDEDALLIATSNVSRLEMEDQVCFIQAQIPSPARDRQKQQHRRRNQGRGGGRKQQRQQKNHRQSSIPPLLTENFQDGLPFRDNCVDTVLTNPPFGTKHNEGMDIRFLRAAVRLASRAVYSFHKTSTRDYVLRTVRGWDHQVSVVAEMKFDIPQMYKFHKQKNVDIHVDLIRVEISKTSNSSDEDKVEGQNEDRIENV